VRVEVDASVEKGAREFFYAIRGFLDGEVVGEVLGVVVGDHSNRA
jgi:hypothetical protein